MMRAMLALMVLLIARPVTGATIRVERDGSGDFTVIQAAVDAAASGDTIRIGPGRYDEGAVVQTPGWTEFVRIVIHQTELTLIGAGAGQTTIGPAVPWDLSQGWNRGVEAGTYWNSLRVHISDMGFENMGLGVSGAEAPDEMTIERCRFLNNAKSVLFYAGGTLAVSDSAFDQMPRNYELILVLSSAAATIDGCQFALADAHFWGQEAVQLESLGMATVTNCTFAGGDRGLALIGMGHAAVGNCVFTNQTAANGRIGCGVLIRGGDVNVTDCAFETQNCALWIDSAPTVTMTRTSVVGVTESSIKTESVNSIVVHDCALAHGPRYSVWQWFPCDVNSTADLPQMDMTNNDWGTSNADTIASWIHACEYAVDFVPYVGQPVATESATWGELKAIFR